MTPPRRPPMEHRDLGPSDRPGEGAPALQIHLLGGFYIYIGSRVITEAEWGRRKAARLVKLLSLAPDHRLQRGQLPALLWPELDPEAAAGYLQRTLHVAGRVLEPDLAPSTPSTYLCLHGDLLALCPEVHLWIDVEAFLAAVAAARRSEDLAGYQAALDLYTGDLLPEDCDQDWTTGRREELRGIYAGLLEELARLHETRGEHRAAMEVLQRLVAAEPAHEAANVRLMCLYAAAGQRHQALRQYQQLAHALSQSHGAEPELGTRHLHQDILAGRFPAAPPDIPDAAHIEHGGATSRNGSPASPDLGHKVRPTNLLPALTSFIGREQEMAEVKRLLAATRLLTLTGAGGSGKTRLAMEVGASLLDTYDDGVWLVELAALREPRLVPQAVALALRVREEPNRSLAETLAHALQSKQLLLVLDNCEHVLDACAHLAESLLRACPGLRILATSRTALGIGGETAWPVPPLAVPDPARLPPLERLPEYDAVRLFLERARATRPDFALTEENARAVVQVCRRLDGIPLAIELATVRVKMMAVEQLAARLDDSFELLANGSRTALPRQQTLRAAIDWSYDLLSRQERVVFQRLSVFAGGWTLSAAQEVCAGDGIQQRDVLDLLGQLVDKSLVVVEAQGERMRYRLLETIRQYSAEKLLQSGGGAQVRRRHQQWCVALAEAAEPALRGPEQGAWLKRLEAEHDNLRAALAWSQMGAPGSLHAEAGLRIVAALGRFWFLRGYFEEWDQWFKAMLAGYLERGDAPARLETNQARARALFARALLALYQTDSVRAAALGEKSLSLYRVMEDRWGIAASLVITGAASYQGDAERGRARLAEGLALARDVGDPWLIALALYILGDVALWWWRDPAQAKVYHHEGLALAREVGDTALIAELLVDLGHAAHHQHDHEQAAALYEESLALFREMGDKLGIARTFFGLGNVAIARGDYAAARALHAERLATEQELGNRVGIGHSLATLGWIAKTEGDYVQARTLLTEGLAHLRGAGNKSALAFALAHLGGLALAEGDAAQATAHWEERLAVAREVGDDENIAASLADLQQVAPA